MGPSQENQIKILKPVTQSTFIPGMKKSKWSPLTVKTKEEEALPSSLGPRVVLQARPLLGTLPKEETKSMH